MIEFNVKNGTVEFKGTPFDKGAVNFKFNEFSYASTELAWEKSKSGATAKAGGCDFFVNIKKSSFSFSVKNSSKKDLYLKGISLAFDSAGQKKQLAAGDWLEYINSFNFCAGSTVKKVGQKNPFAEHNPDSSMAYVLCRRKDKASFMFATVPPHCGDYIKFKALHDAPHMEGNFGLHILSEQERLLKPGKKAETSSMFVASGDDPLELLESFGDLWGKNRKMPLKNVLQGWNSWDYFAGAVTAEDIYKNQKAAQKQFGDAVKYFVIDEGYEPRWGVWEANWKFPKGLKDYCSKIKASGGVPGVWTSALLVNTYTDIYRENPHWFARDNEGFIVTKLYSYGPMAFLDITHPEVEKFIFDTFSRLKSEGFEYFKVDFTQEVLNASVFFDRTVPRGNIIRKAFEVIRKAIGDDAYLLACGAPYESVTETVDASRTTGDIHNFWGHILRNASSMAGKWWMHRSLWNNDPDFLIVRTSETCSLPRMNREYKPKPFSPEDSWLAGREFNLEEAKVYSQLVYLSAGDVFLSDDLCSLNKKGVDMIKKVLESPLSKAAVPVDLFDSHDGLPSIWVANEKDFVVIGVFNWEEDDSEFVIDLSEFGLEKAKSIKSFWTGKEIKPDENVLSLQLDSRSCEAFLIVK